MLHANHAHMHEYIFSLWIALILISILFLNRWISAYLVIIIDIFLMPSLHGKALKEAARGSGKLADRHCANT
jgi:hypothetical protein